MVDDDDNDKTVQNSMAVRVQKI